MDAQLLVSKLQELGLTKIHTNMPTKKDLHGVLNLPANASISDSLIHGIQYVHIIIAGMDKDKTREETQKNIDLINNNIDDLRGSFIGNYRINAIRFQNIGPQYLSVDSEGRHQWDFTMIFNIAKFNN